MTLNGFLEPNNEELSNEQIDNIVRNNIDAGTFLYDAKNDLYVPPSMRNDLSEPGHEHKMKAFGKIIQEHMN